jgi:nucleoside-diphosphate-sugar epimerase
LVHGHNEDIVTEEIVHPLPGLLQSRAQFELDVINAKEVHGIVIRPGFVYGYAGGNGGTNITDKVFNLAGNNGKVVIHGKKDRRHSWVHIYDLANAYYLAIKNYTNATGQIFDIASDAPTYEELYRKAASVAGHKDAEVVVHPFTEDNPWGPFLNQTVRTSYNKAKNLLGWSPSHPNVLDDLENVYVAYKAIKQ